MDKISVIVPVYNVEKYLTRCVTSLINQDYKNLEIILVDDGSTDNSGKLCDDFEKRYRNIIVVHKKNGGLSSARNAGLDIATGTYIGFLDSDDWITSDMYTTLFHLATLYNSTVTQINYTFAKDDKIYIKKRKVQVECIEGKENILKRYLIDGMKEIKSYPVWTKLYKSSCFNNIRFPVGQLYEDVVTNYDILAEAQKYVISNKICYYYFINPQSITRSKFKNKDFEYIKVGEQILNRTKNNNNLKGLGEVVLARTYFMCICKMIKFTCENDVSTEIFINQAIPVLRRNFLRMMFSKMKFDRKITLIFLCLNKRMTEYIVGRK